MAVTLTDENFKSEVLESDIPVLVDFWAPWCPPCQLLGPIIEELAEEFFGKIKVGKLNVDEAPKTAQRYSIMSIPTLKIFKGGEVIEEMVGLRSKEEIARKLEEVTGEAND